MPAPPASARIAKTSRTSVASTASRIASPPQTPATTRSRPLRSKRSADIWLVTRPDHVDPAGTHVCVDHEQSSGSVRDVDVATTFVLVEDIEVADFRVGVHRDGGVARDDDAELAHLDSSPDVCLGRHRTDAGEIELQGAD